MGFRFISISLAVVPRSENHLFSTLHNLCRAADPKLITIENMGIDPGRDHVPVAQ